MDCYPSWMLGLASHLIFLQNIVLSFFSRLFILPFSQFSLYGKGFILRGKYEIAREILSVVEEPSTKTNIVYEANLGFKQADKYIDDLQEKGLLEVHEETRKEYEITDQGEEALELLEKLEDKMALS